MKFIERFENKMTELGITKSSKILLAVSGGVDSMVLLSLSANAGYNVTAAHVNFKLRGEESNSDEKFVRNTCKEMSIPFFSTVAPIDKKNENIQIAAREARYAYFEKLCVQHGFEFVLTAHHRDDFIETFFVHLIRGSGLKGLRSIPEKYENISRPLLDFSKDDILKFASENNINWREDATNKETDYLRNKIRHGLAVEFAEITPFANANLVKSIGFINEAHDYFEREAKRFIASLTFQNGLYFIPDASWKSLFDKKPLHKYVLGFFGFSPDQLPALSTFGESHTGRYIKSHSHIVYRDRNQFVIQAAIAKTHVEIPIGLEGGELSEPLKLKWYSQKKIKNIAKKEDRIALLDMEKLQFPLLIRYWKPGDKFMPLGMRGMKKLSDFLTDLKLSVPEKENIMVVESDGEICWVVGLRIDERFKTTALTQEVFVMELLTINP